MRGNFEFIGKLKQFNFQEAKRRQREAKEKLDRMEKLRRQKLNPDQDAV